jgi:deoxyribonuclease (pyrimidine dimer)
MTRINVVPVEELCDKHLLSEFRELTRIPNNILKGKYSLEGQPKEYTLGTGHVKFFYDKLEWLFMRYVDLHLECCKRGFNVQFIFPPVFAFPANMCRDYVVTEQALSINRARIQERMPAKARWTEYKKGD